MTPFHVIDVGNKAVVKTIKVGDWPCSIKLSQDGSKGLCLLLGQYVEHS